MTRILKFLDKFEKKSLYFSPYDKNILNLSIWKNISKSKNLHSQKRRICVFCIRLMIDGFGNSMVCHSDFHNLTHLMVNDLPNYIPLKSYQVAIDLESSFLNTQLQKNFPIWENYTDYLLKEIILPYQSLNQLKNLRKNREYVFLNYRISNFLKKTIKKKINLKNILHGWSELKGPNSNWISQRGEILTGFPEKCIKKTKSEEKIFKNFRLQSIFFFRSFNKKTYETEIIKRMNCANVKKILKKALCLISLKEIERLHFLKLYEYCSTIFFYTNWKISNVGSNSSLRLSFFDSLFFFYEGRNSYLRDLVRKFIKTCICCYRNKKSRGSNCSEF